MGTSLERKLENLRKRIRRLDSALVAFSGGIDSSFLMRICREELGERAVAVTALSSNYPKSELLLARRIAKVMGVKHIAYDPSGTDAQDEEDVYSSLKSLAVRMKLKNVLDGTHKDDEKHVYSSYAAAKKAGVISPLLESNLTKAEILLLSKKLGLPSLDHSRSISRKKALAKAKRYLERVGVKGASVSSGGRNMYIRSDKAGMMEIVRKTEKIRKKMKSLGFSGVFVLLS